MTAPGTPGAMSTNGTSLAPSPSSKVTAMASRPRRQSGPDISTGIQRRSQASAWASVPSWASLMRLGVIRPTVGRAPARTSETRAPRDGVPAATSSARHSAASPGTYAHGLCRTAYSPLSAWSHGCGMDSS